MSKNETINNENNKIILNYWKYSLLNWKDFILSIILTLLIIFIIIKLNNINIKQKDRRNSISEAFSKSKFILF